MSGTELWSVAALASDREVSSTNARRLAARSSRPPPTIADVNVICSRLSDPRHGEANEAEHNSQSPLWAIREKYRDCSYYQLNEIMACEAATCALWLFRSGRHPWRVEARKSPLTDANSDGNPPSRTRGCRHADPSPRFRPR